MKKKILREQIINECDECRYYKYFRCHGCDCNHPDAPDEEERGDEEPLAENREDNFPKWCPLEEGKFTMKNERIKLWAHCVGEHASILNPEISLSELRKIHIHEHTGPCTIRNHDPKKLSYSLKKIGLVLSEAEK